MDDHGTREYAVRELGEDAVRDLEVEVVKAHAGRLSPGTFVAMGIPTASRSARARGGSRVRRHRHVGRTTDCRSALAGAWIRRSA